MSNTVREGQPSLHLQSRGATMAVETVRILPEKINPEWLQTVYANVTEQGQAELDDFLSAQDLEINEDGKVAWKRLTYHAIPDQACADVLFADGHTEVWKAAVSITGKVESLTDTNGNVYTNLIELRPSENEPKATTIIEIELRLSHSINGF